MERRKIPLRLLTKVLNEDSDTLFDFILAEQFSCTVAELRERMGEDERIYWIAYHGMKAQQMELARQRSG